MPVPAAVKVVVLLAHIVLLDGWVEMAAGLSTVITALPVLSAFIEVQFPSLRAVTVYVLLLEGDTENV